MSKSTFRHASSRTPRGVIGCFGAHHAGESKRYMPRHAAEKSSREGCFPGGEVVKAAVGFIAITAAAIGATNVGASIDGKYVDDEYDKADTSIQQPAERKSAESTGTPPQPAGLDSFVDRAAEENTIVDGGSYVTPCSLGQQEGWIRGNVFCPRPNLSVRPGTRPVGDSNSNMSSAAIDSRKQPTSA